ncbi:hypothetical protein EI555_018715, partial [Monodon monoceros]
SYQDGQDGRRKRDLMIQCLLAADAPKGGPPDPSPRSRPAAGHLPWTTSTGPAKGNPTRGLLQMWKRRALGLPMSQSPASFQALPWLRANRPLEE